MNQGWRKFLPQWHDFNAQLFVLTILPLTLLLLIIAFGGFYLHQRAMRTLVGERDKRAVQAAAVAFESELHHRAASITDLALLADTRNAASFDDFVNDNQDVKTDFDGGLAWIDGDTLLFTTSYSGELWDWVLKNRPDFTFASPSDSQPVFSSPALDPDSNRTYVVVSAYSPSGVLAAGAFSPEILANETLTASYPADNRAAVYLLDASGRLLFESGGPALDTLPPDYSGILTNLPNQSGIAYASPDGTEHVLAYSVVSTNGWVLLSDEPWETVVSPSLQTTQMAPLVLVPAFILALIALWFGARRIVQPLQQLESKAAALAWGDFAAIREPVGGISEVQHLQQELTEMAHKVQAAQEGLHDYIGAITSAQEEERRRMARELHDDTIQAIIALRQRVQLVEKSVKDPASRRSLRELETLTEGTIENLRRLTRALRPIYLEDLGLATALEMLARETSENHPLTVKFQRTGQEHRLDGVVELALYRIAQEALNNVVHHANADRALLHIIFHDNGVILEVSDDGDGFQVPSSPTDFAPNRHFGLLGMHERAELIGARLSVESTSETGTRLTVRI